MASKINLSQLTPSQAIGYKRGLENWEQTNDFMKLIMLDSEYELLLNENKGLKLKISKMIRLAEDIAFMP